MGINSGIIAKSPKVDWALLYKASFLGKIFYQDIARSGDISNNLDLEISAD